MYGRQRRGGTHATPGWRCAISLQTVSLARQYLQAVTSTHNTRGAGNRARQGRQGSTWPTAQSDRAALRHCDGSLHSGDAPLRLENTRLSRAGGGEGRAHQRTAAYFSSGSASSASSMKAALSKPHSSSMMHTQEFSSSSAPMRPAKQRRRGRQLWSRKVDLRRNAALLCLPCTARI